MCIAQCSTYVTVWHTKWLETRWNPRPRGTVAFANTSYIMSETRSYKVCLHSCHQSDPNKRRTHAVWRSIWRKSPFVKSSETPQLCTNPNFKFWNLKDNEWIKFGGVIYDLCSGNRKMNSWKHKKLPGENVTILYHHWLMEHLSIFYWIPPIPFPNIFHGLIKPSFWQKTSNRLALLPYIRNSRQIPSLLLLSL